MIKYTEKFFSKKFYDEESKKKAYLKACKWLAKYVLSKPEFQSVLYSIKKEEQKNSLYCFELTLFTVLDEKELRERNCAICKESHSSFFISEETNCDWCKSKAYQRRTDEMISRKTGYYKDLIKKILLEE